MGDLSLDEFIRKLNFGIVQKSTLSKFVRSYNSKPIMQGTFLLLTEMHLTVGIEGNADADVIHSLNKHILDDEQLNALLCMLSYSGMDHIVEEYFSLYLKKKERDDKMLTLKRFVYELHNTETLICDTNETYISIADLVASLGSYNENPIVQGTILKLNPENSCSFQIEACGCDDGSEHEEHPLSNDEARKLCRLFSVHSAHTWSMSEFVNSLHEQSIWPSKKSESSVEKK